ncbi:MAG: NfeD family protein [Chloroflexota bacterium]|jgi:membrane-bound serine protease (ClpP class)
MFTSRLKFQFILQIIFLFVASAVHPLSSSAQGDHVALVQLKGVINPVAASYVERAINQAETDGANVVVIQMDTPGGLDTSMRAIIQRIIGSKVPVVVYVSPPGARAGSAGVYITYSAHIAAMAPNTNIGSAHPVAVGEGGEQQMSETMQDKVTNDAVAYIKSLAQSRGRNVDWAEKAVRESVNVTAQEALELKVIDLVADDISSLLDQIHGREVQLSTGKTTLNTKDAPIVTIEMSPFESLLHAVSDPTIAYILLSLGTMGLIFELSNPGAILPGVVGGICLLFALFGLGTLPINLAGVLLIAFALILFVADIFAPTHGILTAGGTISFILGSMMLINTQNAPFLSISMSAIVAVSLGLTAFFSFVVAAVVRSHRRHPTTGMESMLGQVGKAKTPLNPAGMVLIDGALWKAVSETGEVAQDELIEVTGARGLTLVVRPRPAEKQL